MPRQPSVRVFGRYELYDQIASGGMASVHLARMAGPAGFTRTVAVKRLHRHFADDPDFSAMLLDEARLVSRIRHPNVVPTLDVVADNGELLLVMEYAAGESLARILRAAGTGSVPFEVIASILVGVLQGLHAAHEARDERGASLGLVHRDVSPQNILVGLDGVSRILDFGIAKAAGRSHTTRDGAIKGKVAYMAPEQIEGAAVDRRTDIHAAGILLWEMLTRRRLFGTGENDADVIRRVLEHQVERPGKLVEGLPLGADEVTLRALARDPMDRFGTAREMALALEGCFGHASPTQVGEWVDARVGDGIRARATRLAEIERDAHESTSQGHGAVPAEPASSVTHPSDTTQATSSAAVPPLSRRRGATMAVASALAVAGALAAVVLVPRLARIGTVAAPALATTASLVATASSTVALEVAPAPEPPTEPPAASSVPLPYSRPAFSKLATPRANPGYTVPPPPATASPTAAMASGLPVPCTKRRWVPDGSGILHPVPDCP